MATTQETGLEVGKRWVEDTVRRVAGESKVAVDKFRWMDDFPGAFWYTLYFDAQGAAQRGAIEFSMRQMEDCGNPNKQTARAGVETQIRSSLQEVLPHLSQSGRN